MRSAALIARLTVGTIVVAALAGVLALTGGPRAAATPSATAVAPAASSQAPATSAWVPLADPFASLQRHGGIAAFGDAGVAVVGDGGAIVVSANGGTTWNAPRAAGAAADLDGVAFSDASRGWAVGAAGTIIATTDGGATWNSQTADAKVDLSAVDIGGVAFSDASHGWAVGAAGTIIATTDGGATWNSQTANAKVDLSAVDSAVWPSATPVTAGRWAPPAPSSPRPTAAPPGTRRHRPRPTISSARLCWAHRNPSSWSAASRAARTHGVVGRDLDDRRRSAHRRHRLLRGRPRRSRLRALDGRHVERTLSYGAVPLTLSASSSTLTAAHDVE